MTVESRDRPPIVDDERAMPKLKNSSPIAICMATDLGYAFPTAVVAKSIVQRQCPYIGPIYFVWVDNASPPRELTNYLEKNGIILVAAQNSLLRSMAPAYPSHLTPASAARLFLANVLEKFAIGKFLYFDGDIEIAGPLDALAKIDLPHDHIAAVEASGLVLSTNNAKATLKWQERLHNLGMPKGASYFNAGVILAHMESWGKISVDAQKFHLENAEACLSFDQCALNAICHDKRLVLSPKWNFQSNMFHLDVETIVAPAIVHFSGRHKPWSSVPPARPWKARKPFLAARTEMPELWKKMALRGSVGNSYRLYRAMLRQKFMYPSNNEREIFLNYLTNTKFSG